MTDDIYDRQRRIPGWNQDNLKDADVAIIGSDALAHFTAAVLAGLGVGFIKIYSNKKIAQNEPRHFLTTQSPVGEYRVYEMEKTINKINPNIRCMGIVERLTDLYDCDILGAPSAIIDTTNNPYTEKSVFDYGRAHNVSVINGNSAKFRATISCNHKLKSKKTNDDLTERVNEEELKKLEYRTKEAFLSGDIYEEGRQDAITSAIASGLIADEFRKLVVPLEDDAELLRYRTIEYNLRNTKRFAQEKNMNIKENHNERKKLLQIGAGSIGNIVGLLAAILDYDNTIIDNDETEWVNLNRQVMLYEKVGVPKSKGLTENLRLVNPKAHIRHIKGFFDENYDGQVPDVILDCVDKVKSRLSMHNYVKKKFNKNKLVPIISGGTSFKSGQVVVVVPGQTLCFNHARGLDALIEKEIQEESCRTDPNPSVIISNWLMGSLMMAEVYAMFHFKPYKVPKGSLEYDISDKERARFVSVPNICNCYEEVQHVKSNQEIRT